MSTAGGPKLHGIGRGGDSNLVLEMDAHDAGSYPGEPTTNELFDPRTTIYKGWGSSVLYPTKTFPIAPTVAHSRTSGLGSVEAPVPVPGKIEFGTYWDKTWWQGDIDLGTNRAFSAGDTIVFSGWYLPWTSDLPAIIAANRGLTDTRLGLHIYASGYLGLGLYLSPIANGTQLVDGFNNWWYFESVVTIPAGGVTGSVRIEDRGWDYYFNNSGSAGGAEVFDVEYYWCNVQIELKPYRTPLVRARQVLGAGGISPAHARPASTNLMIHGDVGTGTSFYDSSPSKHTITNYASQMTHSSAQSKFSGGAIYGANVSNNFLVVADSTDFDFGTSTDFTVDYWMYHAGTIASWDCMFELGSIYNNGVGNYLNADGRIRTHVTTAAYDSAGGVITENTWYHIAVVRSGAVWTTYVNGVSVATTTRGGDTIGQYTDAFHIHNGVHTTTYPWAGYIDEFRVTKGTALWLKSFTPPALPSRCPDGPVVDLSGHHNAGNFATIDMTDVRTYNKGQVIEPVASAVWDFDGTDDLIDLGNINYNGLPGLTVGTWVYSSAFGANDTFLSSWGDNVYSNYAWLLFASQWVGSKIDWLISSNGVSYTRCAGTLGLTNNLWYYVVGTWNPSGAMVLYVNGVLDGTATGPTSIMNNDFNTFIGCDSDGSSEAKVRFFGGQMGNATIWKTTLTAAQVKQNFNSQRSRFKV